MNTEQGLLSVLLNNPSKLGLVPILASDFEDPTNAAIYQAMVDVQPNSPIDIVSVSEYLEKQTGQNWVRSVGLVANAPGSVRNLETYAENIKHRAKQKASREILTHYLYRDGDLDINALTSELMRVGAEQSKSRIKSMRDVVTSAFHDIEKAYETKGIPGISTGFNSIDEKLGGLHPSDLVVIGARPAMGKTAFVVSMMLSSPAKSFFVSGEMSERQVGARFISQRSFVPATRLRNGELQEDDWPKLTNGMEILLSKKLWVYDKPNPDIDEVCQQARIARHEHQIEVIYCDYLQKFCPDGRDSKVERVGEVAIKLKGLARELDCPVVALAQLNRNLEKRPDKRPIMSDLEGAGAIEQEADSIGFLYRDNVYNENSPPNEAEIRWEKNRHGPTGYMPLDWNPQTMTFSDNGGWL
jgi:replicative DNA helicase